MPRSIACAVFFLVSSTVACGGGSSPITASQFALQYAQNVCSAVAPACLVQVATCVSGRQAEMISFAQTQISAHRDFIPTNAETCLSTVAGVYGKLNQGQVALKPADLAAIDSACADVYRGAGQQNGICAIDADCTAGLICDKGRCGVAKLVAQGAGCANIGEYCPQGFYCGEASGVLLCEQKLITGQACDTANPCLESLRCAAGVCAAQLGIGDTCGVDQDCATGFCEPYALKCAEDVRFANGSAACVAMGS